MANTNDQSTMSHLGTESDFALQKRSKPTVCNNSRRAFNGIGPKIDTNLEEARRLAALDSKLKKQKEIAEIISQHIDSSKGKQKESSNKIKAKLILDINNSNWNISNKNVGLKHDLQGVNSAKNANLTPRMGGTFDFSVHNPSETTGFQTPLTCKKKSELK